MGILKQLVLLPVAPVRGVVWLTERIAEAAELEHGGDPAVVRQQMVEAQMAFERGEIDEAELAAIEDSLLARLEVGHG